MGGGKTSDKKSDRKSDEKSANTSDKKSDEKSDAKCDEESDTESDIGQDQAVKSAHKTEHGFPKKNLLLPHSISRQFIGPKWALQKVHTATQGVENSSEPYAPTDPYMPWRALQSATGPYEPHISV